MISTLIQQVFILLIFLPATRASATAKTTSAFVTSQQRVKFHGNNGFRRKDAILLNNLHSLSSGSCSSCFPLLTSSSLHLSPSSSQDVSSWSRVHGQKEGLQSSLFPCQQQQMLRQQQKRQSVASVQTNLFGLGAGEIVIILVVLGAVLGPENIGRIVKSSGNRAQELSEEMKRIPDEFQKGLEEGEDNVRARKAKRIKVISKEEMEKEEREK